MHNPLDMAQIKNPMLRGWLQKASGLGVLKEWYDDWLKTHDPDNASADIFIQHVLKRMNSGAEIINEDTLESIPKTGPVLIVANHPLGGLEGMILTQMLLSIRPDLKVLTNELLKIFPEFKDVFIGVDVLNQKKQLKNSKGIREVTRHLSNDGAMLIFPAGTVSQLKLRSMTLEDAPWNPIVSRLARKYDAPIMPIYIEGRNSIPFYLSGHIHKRLRTMLLPRAMISKTGQNIPIHIGELIPASDLRRIKNDEIATSYARLCCEVLPRHNDDDAAQETFNVSDIKDNIAPNLIASHINQLKDCMLHSEGDFSIYCVPYARLGPVMEQLAIERERTFRQVDEGTGKELDSDRFDPHYDHLFLWNHSAKKIAGGYRIGATNNVIKTKGLQGLYSHSLFDYDQKFVEKMGNTIELGRSFITPEYQRHPKALDMLWKGIGRFVALNPQYHTLFGCVSISRQYSKLVSALLTETFLSHYSADNSIKQGVKARKPVDVLKTPWNKNQIASLHEVPIVNKLVGRIDAGKSIPVLIRHYLALNGRFISFTVNEGFNSSLDGLIMVDLRQSPDKYLNRYMGVQGLERFRTEWKGYKNVA